MKRSTALLLALSAIVAGIYAVIAFNELVDRAKQKGDYAETITRFESAMAETNLVVADAITDCSLTYRNQVIARERMAYAQWLKDSGKRSAHWVDAGEPVKPVQRLDLEPFSIEEVLGPAPPPRTELHAVTSLQVYAPALGIAGLVFTVGTVACFFGLLLLWFLCRQALLRTRMGLRYGWQFFLARIRDLSQAIRNNDTNKT